MPPKKPVEEPTDFTPPEQDPFVLFKRLTDALLARQEALEQRVANLEVTWNRLLNVSQEAPLRQFPPQHTIPTAYTVENQEATPTTDKPKWEIEKEKPKPKKKTGNKLLIAGAIILIGFLVLMWLLRQGWTCSMPSI